MVFKYSAQLFFKTLLPSLSRLKRSYILVGFFCSMVLHAMLIFLLLGYFSCLVTNDNDYRNAAKLALPRNIRVFLYQKNDRLQSHEKIIKNTRAEYNEYKMIQHNIGRDQSKKNVQITARENLGPPPLSAVASDKILRILHDLIQQNVQYSHGMMAGFLNKTTLIGFNLYPDGHIDGVAIVASSGAKILDTAAFAAVQTLPKVTDAAKLLDAARHFIVPIVFR